MMRVGAQTLAQGLLQTKEASELGPGYMLAGTIMTKQEVTDVQDRVVTLQVAVAGTWYYQFDDLQRQTLANNWSTRVVQWLRAFLSLQRGCQSQHRYCWRWRYIAK